MAAVIVGVALELGVGEVVSVSVVVTVGHRAYKGHLRGRQNAQENVVIFKQS